MDSTEVDNPYVKLVIGLSLLITSLQGTWSTLSHDLAHLNFKAHHGVALFAVFHLLITISGLLQTIETVSDDVTEVQGDQKAHIGSHKP